MVSERSFPRRSAEVFAKSKQRAPAPRSNFGTTSATELVMSSAPFLRLPAIAHLGVVQNPLPTTGKLSYAGNDADRAALQTTSGGDRVRGNGEHCTAASRLR